jgi:ABC-2 type transport system permease protein
VTDALTGFWILVRHAVRLDRIRLIAWIVGIAFIPVVTYASYDSLYPTLGDRITLGATLESNPAFALLLGPASNLGEAGGYTAWRTVVIAAAFLAVMSILTVVRHTRTDEESGRTELLAAGCVGRFAFLAAGIGTAAFVCLLTGLAIVIGLVASGAAPTGAIAYAAAVAAGGLVFAGVAAIAVQIGSFGRTAISLSVGALAIAYLLRAWGDASSYHWLTWLSPLGWTEKIHAFSSNAWWTLVVSLLATIALVGIAVVLVARRDFGRGLLAAHHGPADAPASLSGTFGLSWRLHRGRLAGWMLGLAAYGAIAGSVANSVGSVIAHSGLGQRFLGSGHNFVELYIAELINVMGIVAAVYGIQAVLCARSEETDGRVEELLSTPLTRGRWFASHLVFALAGSALVVIVGGLSTGIAAQATGASTTTSAVMAASLVQIPAIWLIVGATAALIGVVPRASQLGWPIIAATFVISFFGPLLKLPHIVLDASAFTHVPHLPGGSVDAVPLIAMSAIAVALLGVGMIGMRRRSILS